MYATLHQAALSINGLWSVLNKIGVTLTPIEKEEVKAGFLQYPADFVEALGW